MKHGRRSVATVGAFLAVTLLSACGTPKAGLTGGDGAATISLMALPDPTGSMKTVVDSCNATLNGAATIELKEITGDDPRTQLTRMLSARDTTVDLMAIPVAWTPEFAATGWAEELRGSAKDSAKEGSLGGPLNSVTHQKKVYGAPLTADVHVLWYRKDLVTNPPATWADLITTSNQLAKQNKVHNVEVAGLHEGGNVGPLFTALANSYGSPLVDKEAKRAVVDEDTKAAATLLKSFAVSEAFDATAFASSTDVARSTFANGDAAFLIDFAGAFGTKLPKDAAIAAYPKVNADREARPTLAGTNLVVSAYSEHQKQAVKAMNCMRSAENVRVFYGTGSLPATQAIVARPGETALTQDPTLQRLVNNATAPLQTPVGDAVDAAITKALLPLDTIDPETVNDKLSTAIDEALDFTAEN